MAAWHARLVLSVLAVALTAAACADGADSAIDAQETDSGDFTSGAQRLDEPAGAESPTTTPRESESPRAEMAVLDETIPAENIHGDYWPMHENLWSISCASDIVFLGRITGYTENLLTIPPVADGPRRTRDVYDGLVFTVDEVLVGDPGNGAGQVMVAYRALFVNDYGMSPSRVVGAPFGVIRSGIVQRNDPDRPRYLVYAVAAKEDSPFHLPGVFYFNTNGGVTQFLDDGSLAVGANRPFWPDHGFRGDDAREAADGARRLCVRPPLPPGVLDIWRDSTGLARDTGEYLWARRLDRVCKTALGQDLDSPVWDRAVGLALAGEFTDADGLRPDLPPESHQRYVEAAAQALWLMIVQPAAPDAPGVCWEAVPQEFLEAGLARGGSTGLAPEFDTSMTAEAVAAVREWADRTLWWVEPPLPPGIRDIWWEATGLRATIDEDRWADRLNRACNTPVEDPVWSQPAAAALAEEFIVEDGGEPLFELLEAGLDALWEMTTVPPAGACPWHYPPDTFEPEFFEQMKEIRRAALR